MNWAGAVRRHRARLIYRGDGALREFKPWLLGHSMLRPYKQFR